MDRGTLDWQMTLSEWLGLGRLVPQLATALERFSLWLRRRVKGRRGSMSAQQKLAKLQELKKEVSDWIAATNAKGYRQDVILRNIDRIDDYSKDLRGESDGWSYSRAGLVGTYHRGIRVALQVVGIEHDTPDTWRLCDPMQSSPEGVAMCVGLLPWENVEMIDWSGDEYYMYPHIYCYFDEKHTFPTPFEKRELCEIRSNNNRTTYHSVIEDYDVARMRLERSVQRHRKN